MQQHQGIQLPLSQNQSTPNAKPKDQASTLSKSKNATPTSSSKPPNNIYLASTTNVNTYTLREIIF
jgi:hypothetical protein